MRMTTPRLGKETCGKSDRHVSYDTGWRMMSNASTDRWRVRVELLEFAIDRLGASLVEARDLVVAGLIDGRDDLLGVDLLAVLDRDGLIVERHLDALDAR